MALVVEAAVCGDRTEGKVTAFEQMSNDANTHFAQITVGSDAEVFGKLPLQLADGE